MLKKECCEKCWNETKEDNGWNKLDKLRWKLGYIYCPFRYIKEKGEYVNRNITDEPPIKCPYYLENII